MHLSSLFLLVLCATWTLTSALQDESVAELVRREVSKQLREITEKSRQQEKTIRELELKIKTKTVEYDRKILELQETVKTLKKKCDCCDKDKIQYETGNHGNFRTENYSENNNYTTTPDKRIRQLAGDVDVRDKKRLLENNISDGQMVAFYAWMNNHETNPGTHHTIIYDGVQSNLGSAYDRYTGIFRTPTTGYYVFSWTIVADEHSWIYSELVVNSTPFGFTLANSQDSTDEQTTTGLVVLPLKQGDDVFVRTSPNPGHGKIYSGPSFRSSFSGWRIA